jgi:hypothetical protein
MMKTLRVTVIGLLICLAAPAARAAGLTIALFPPTGDNVSPQILQASRELLKDHLLRTGAYNVVEPPAAPELALEPTPAQAGFVAAQMGASEAVVVRITHLGNTARVRLTIYAAGSGQIVYWDSIAVTGGPDELDTVFQRLAHAMQTGKPLRDSAEIDTVTDKEMQQLGRRQANKVVGVHLLTLLPLSSAASSFGAVPGGGLFWLYDARSWMADLSFDLGFGSEDRKLFSAAIGGFYPFLREDFTPYFGGVVRWAYMNLGGDGAGGISVQPTLGLLMGRLSTVQLRADVGYFINTFGELPSPPPQGATATCCRKFGQGLVFTLGLGFN